MIDLLDTEVLDLALPKSTKTGEGGNCLNISQELSAGGWKDVGGSSACHSPSPQPSFLTMATPALWSHGPDGTPSLKAWTPPCLLGKAGNAPPNSRLKPLAKSQRRAWYFGMERWHQWLSLLSVTHLLGFGFDFVFYLWRMIFYLLEELQDWYLWTFGH